MPVQATNCQETKAESKMNLLLVGPEKGGKSLLASTAPQPVLFLDHDDRSQAVAGKHGVYALTFRDETFPKQPVCYSETLDVIAMLEKGSTVRHIMATYKCPGAAAAPDVPPATVVLDSAITFGNHARGYALYTNKDIRRRISIGDKFAVDLPNSWDGWTADTQMVESAMLRLMALPSNFIMTIHMALEESEDSTDTAPKFTGKIAVYPRRYKALIKNYSDVWLVTRGTNNSTIPIVQVMPTYNFTTAALTLHLDQLEVNAIGPNIAALVAKSLSKK